MHIFYSYSNPYIVEIKPATATSLTTLQLTGLMSIFSVYYVL